MRLYLHLIFYFVVIVSVSLFAQASAEIFMLNNAQILLPGGSSIILLGVGIISLITMRRR